jgi:acyl dehydratase
MTIPEVLPAISHTVTQAQLAKYADASGDHNPLHLDEAFAAATPYGRTIAHGMLVLAFVSETMAKNFGRTWMCEGDTVTTTGTLKSISDAMATYEIIVRKQDGIDAVTVDAAVPVPA